MSQKQASETLALESREKKLRSKSFTSDSAVVEDKLLSRFAPTYTPLWLKQVNISYPSLVIPLSPSSSSDSPYSLIAELYPPKLLQHFLTLEASTTSRIKSQLASLLPQLSATLQTSPEPSSLPLQPLSSSTYAAHFLPLHLLEYSSRSLELHKSNLYNVPLKPYASPSLSSKTNLNLYALPTPFIRESWPPIQMGDTCFVRPLVESEQRWMGVEVEAKVWAVERIRGEVILSVEEGAMEWLGGKVEGEKEENGEKEEETEGVKVNIVWKIQGELEALSRL